MSEQAPGWRVTYRSERATGTLTVYAWNTLEAEVLAEAALAEGERVVNVEWLGAKRQESR